MVALASLLTAEDELIHSTSKQEINTVKCFCFFTEEFIDNRVSTLPFVQLLCKKCLLKYECPATETCMRFI